MKNIYGKRRCFLKGAALFPLGMAARNSQTLNAADYEPSKANRQSAKIKLSINAWSYYMQLNRHLKGESGGMSLFDMLEECARLEVDAVDPTGYFFPGYPNVPDSKFINEFKRRAFQLGLEFSGTGIRPKRAPASITPRGYCRRIQVVDSKTN